MEKIEVLCQTYNGLEKAGLMNSWLECGFQAIATNDFKEESFTSLFHAWRALKDGTSLSNFFLGLVTDKASCFKEWTEILPYLHEESSIRGSLVSKIRNYVVIEGKQEELGHFLEHSYSKDKERMTPMFSDLIFVP